MYLQIFDALARDLKSDGDLNLSITVSQWNCNEWKNSINQLENIAEIEDLQNEDMIKFLSILLFDFFIASEKVAYHKEIRGFIEQLPYQSRAKEALGILNRLNPGSNDFVSCMRILYTLSVYIEPRLAIEKLRDIMQKYLRNTFDISGMSQDDTFQYDLISCLFSIVKSLLKELNTDFIDKVMIKIKSQSES